MNRRALLSVITAALAATAPAFAASEASWTGDFGIPSFDGPTRACAVFQGRYVVGGDFQWASGTRASNVAVWHAHTFIAGTPGTGEDWIEVGGGLPSPARRLAVWGPTLLAGTDSYLPGSTPVMQYEGSTSVYLWAGMCMPLAAHP